MKYILLLIILGIALAQIPQREMNTDQYTRFRLWLGANHRRYPSAEVRLYRLSVFKENLERVRLLQAQDPDAIYTATKFSDLSPEEFEQKYLKSSKPIRPRSRRFSLFKSAAPDSWDWAEKEAVTNIKDQGECDSAWAQSTIACIEGYHAIAHKQLTDLSVQQIIDCDKEDTGCDGGNPDTAFTYAIEAGGVMSDYDYPYTGVKGECKFDQSKIVAKVLDFSDVPKQDESQFKEALYSAGPVAAMLNAASLQFYDGGIFNPPICNASKLTHVVSCIGYGVDSKKDKPFWRCKNSWGDNWGEQGFFRIIRGKNRCGIAQDATYGHVA